MCRYIMASSANHVALVLPLVELLDDNAREEVLRLLGLFVPALSEVLRMRKPSFTPSQSVHG